MSILVHNPRHGEIEMPDAQDERDFVALGNANRMMPYTELYRHWHEDLGRPMPWKKGLELLRADGGEWWQALDERRREGARKANAAARARGYVPTGRKKMPSSAQVKATVQGGGFTSQHGPDAPERRPVADPHDNAADCRRYVAEWRKIRRGWITPTLADYQAANEAMRGRVVANTTERRERERKAVVA